MFSLTNTLNLSKSEIYIGDALSDNECDLIALTRFNLKLFDGEVELQQRCWFDYRYMHPIKRTYLFADEYMRQFKQVYAKYIDADNEHIIGLSRPNDPLDNRPAVNKTAKLRTPTYLIKARQLADALCIPYPFFIGTGLRFVMKDRFYKALLGYNADSKMRLHIQASSLYNDATIEHVRAEWKALNKCRITWCENPRLCFTDGDMQAQEDEIHPYKLQYERYLAKSIMTKVVKEFSVESALNRRFMRPRIANKVLSFSHF